MHNRTKLGLAALSLGAAAATLAVSPAHAQVCDKLCEPVPGDDPYLYKIQPVLSDLMHKFGQESTIFHKIETVLAKIETVLHKVEVLGDGSV